MVMLSPYGMEVEDIGPGVTLGSQDAPVAVAPVPAPVPAAPPQMVPPEVRYDGYSALVGGGVPPAVQRSGTYYSPNGMREGAELYGAAPAIRQTQPYAMATGYMGYDPYGNLSVQNLVGYPSVYPHVLRGYSLGPEQRLMPWIQAIMPAWWNNPPQVQMPAPGVRRGGGGGTRAASTQPVTTTTAPEEGAPVQTNRGLILAAPNDEYLETPLSGRSVRREVIDPIDRAGAGNVRTYAPTQKRAEIPTPWGTIAWPPISLPQEVEIPEYDDMNIYLDEPLAGEPAPVTLSPSAVPASALNPLGVSDWDALLRSQAQREAALYTRG